MTSERSAREDRPHIVLHVNEAVADEDFSAAKTALENGFDVEAQQRVEFGAAPEPRIFIDLTGAIDAIAPALAAHGLYDILINALSFLFAGQRVPEAHLASRWEKVTTEYLAVSSVMTNSPCEMQSTDFLR
jgi:hypothetical protein